MSIEKSEDDPIAQLRRLAEALDEVDEDAFDSDDPLAPLDARGRALADSIRARVAAAVEKNVAERGRDR